MASLAQFKNWLSTAFVQNNLHETAPSAMVYVVSLEERSLLSAVILSSKGIDPSSGSSLLASAASPLAAPPFALTDTFLLHSRPGASKVIYLDFDGHTTAGTLWNTQLTGGRSFTQTAYSIDTNSAFSDLEKERIQRIWQRVVEDFSPFDVDVTTQEPPLDDLRNLGGFDNRWGVRVVIGSTTTFGTGAGGIAFVGSFSWSTDTPAYVFENNLLNGDEKSTAEAITHEVGHALGLVHDGRTTPLEEYYSGQGVGATGWAPIMGVGYDREVVQWSQGEYANANNTEDDLSIITTGNGFGYRPDDFGNTISSALNLSPTVSVDRQSFVVNKSGVIEQRTDSDWFRLDVQRAGTISLTINGAPASPNLDILAELYDSSGNLLVTSNPTDALNATINRAVSSGTYFLKIDGVGKGDPLTTGYSDYGSLGQYTITGTFPRFEAPAAPEITVSQDSTILVDGSSVFDFGGSTFGSPVDRVFVVRNAGSLDLVVNPVTVSGNFSIVSNLSTNQVITAGGQASFTVRMNASLLGPALGTVSFTNNDSDESPFNFSITGNVTQAAGAEVAVSENGVNLPNLWNFTFGNTPTGSPQQRTFVVRNLGLSRLELGQARIDGAGFTILQNLPAGLNPGESASLIVRMDSGAPGSPRAKLLFNTNDFDENPFTLNLQGRIEASGAEIAVSENGVNLPDGLTFTFGTTQQNTSQVRTFVVRNLGNSVLNLGTVSLSGTDFTILQNLPASINRGGSANLVIRMNAAIAGAKSAELAFTTNDADESPFNLRLIGNVSGLAPEIAVTHNNVNIPDGWTFTYGSIPVGGTQTRTFVVKNTGGSNLVLSPASINGTGFTITQNLPSVLAPNTSANLTIEMATATIGARRAEVVFTNNDSDEGRFNITLIGSVTGPTRVLDDGDVGFTSSGSWVNSVGAGFNLDQRIASPTSSTFATWSFTGLDAGTYRISATWSSGTNRASNANYSFQTQATGSSTLTTLGSATTSQRTEPADFVDSGAGWRNLGTVTLSGNNLIIRLNGAGADGVLVADGIRIERIG